MSVSQSAKKTLKTRLKSSHVLKPKRISVTDLAGEHFYQIWYTSLVMLVYLSEDVAGKLELLQQFGNNYDLPLRLVAASLRRVEICLVHTLVMILKSSPDAFGFCTDLGATCLITVAFFHNFSLSVGNGLVRTVSPDCRSANSLVPLL